MRAPFTSFLEVEEQLVYKNVRSLNVEIKKFQIKEKYWKIVFEKGVREYLVF